MKVKELIFQLQQCNPEAEVEVETGEPENEFVASVENESPVIVTILLE